MRLENLSALCGARRHIKTGKSILQGFLSFLLLKKAIKRLRKKIMAKRKKKTSQEEKENVVESADLEGQTNLGFEPCEPGDIVKTRSKEDISTLNKNLANLEQAY